MTYELGHLSRPDEDLEITDFTFTDDLRIFFLNLESNQDITNELKNRGVITETDQEDSEYSRIFVYFKTEAQAKAFLDRMNDVPEIRDYVEPTGTVLILSADWKTLNEFLSKTLTTEQYDAMVALNITVDEFLGQGL